jgi:hypothetical protein
MLQARERSLGRYRVQHVKFERGGWQTDGPWLRLIVTDQRLVVLPDDPRQQDIEPLVIWRHAIARAWSVGLGKRDGGVIALHSGDLLYFYVDWSQSARLIRDINSMLKTSLRSASAVPENRLTN